MLKNIASTEMMCSEISVLYETSFKSIGINTIDIFITNNGDESGMLIFNLEKGIYQPVVNSIH